MSEKAQVQLKQSSPASFTPVSGGALQRKCACGNHTVAGGECAECAKNKSGLQRKLTIGASNDPLELEADRVADQVLAAPTHSSVSGAPLRIQRYSGQAKEGSDTSPASVDSVLASSGRPLEPALRQDMEQRFGHDFSGVRVHSGAAAEQSARDVNAHAYTVGHDIVFGAGRFAPGTHDGRRLLAHELAHVVQQESGLVSRHVQRASISHQQVTWDNYKGSVPSSSPFGAVTESGLDIPKWKPKVDITDTKEACMVDKKKATKHTAKVWIDPAQFDMVQAIMDEDKSWARPKYKNPDKFCDGVVTQCSTEIGKQVAAASQACKTEVKPCQQAFVKGSTRYAFEVSGTKIEVTSKAECSTKLVSDCEKVMSKSRLFELKDHNAVAAKATSAAECSNPKFKEDCAKHYKDWSPRILRHEQGHFDISNVTAGKAKADLKAKSAQFVATATECGKDNANTEAMKKFNALNALAQLGQSWIDLGKQAEKDYDDETDHGLKQDKQTAWNKKIADGLKEYDLNKPAAPTPKQTPP